MTAHPAINDLITGLRAVSRATAHVEWEKDPNVPGRTAYRISGATKEVVQHAIDSKMRYVEEHGGFAQFTNPGRLGDGYAALGEVILAAAPVTA